MSIEVSPPSNEPHKTSASSSAHAGKGKGKAGAADAAGGFNAILGALDDGSGATPGTSAALAADGGKDGVLGAALDAAALLAQIPQTPPLAAAMPAVKAEGDLAAGTVPGAGKGKPGLALPAGKPGDLQADAGEGPGKGLKSQGAHARATQMAAAAADASANATAAGANAATGQAGDAKDTKLAVALEFMKAVQAPVVTEQPLPTTGIAKPEKSTSERINAANQNADSSYAPSPIGVSNNYSDNATAPGGVAPAPEVQVAEQVKYWMSHDVQNAELKLDGLGKDPVQVSITMTGNEAHIAFRTDETQTRGVLEGAAAHLKDMLGREGVVLTGMSVGTSSSGNQADTGGERRPRQGVRQAFVAPPIGAIAAAGGRAPVSSGRALDLFV